MKKYDVVLIGGGPGGYVAAIRCAQLGLATALVDEWVGADGKPALGGTCLNVGCIPSKALLDSSHHYHNLAHLLPTHGISVKGASMDVATMLKRKDKVVQTMNRGVAALLKKSKVDAYCGHGRLEAGNRVSVTRHGNGGEEMLAAKSVIIASGSIPVSIPVAPIDGDRIVDNAGALAFDEVPGRLGIIGAGVIGLELGSVWNRLGSEVVILEALEDFLAVADRQIARDALKSFKKQGLDIRLGARVTGAKAGKKSVAVKYEGSDGAKAVEVDRLVVAVGRRAYTEGLVGADVTLAMDNAGRIQVDDMCRTSIDDVYAIGDVVKGPMLAHKASEEGVAVAEHIAGHAAHIDHRTVPWVIYTHPEIAWVGDTEQQLVEKGIEFHAGSFPYRALGRAHGAGETEGFIKVLADSTSDEILGVHIFGAQASELIAEAVTAMVFRASSEDLARTIHAHPTLSEAMHEAALAVDGRAIHI
jgi:dihydrolipoamide dehydrogenase